MTPQEEAARIVVSLISKGFTQTDIARGLGLTAKGSGSYVGQVAKGLKGSQKVGELRQLAKAAARARAVPEGRKGAEERQRMLGHVSHTPRKAKSGAAARVRQPGTKVTAGKRGQAYGQAVDASAGLENSGGPNCTKLIEAYAGYDPRGRIAIRIVGRFARESAAHRSSYWRKFYGKRKHKPGRKKGSANVLEASFGNGREGYSAADWLGMIRASGTFTLALRQWLDSNGYDTPDKILRVEVTAWLGPVDQS